MSIALGVFSLGLPFFILGIIVGKAWGYKKAMKGIRREMGRDYP